MRENTDQKNSEHGHFSRSALCVFSGEREFSQHEQHTLVLQWVNDLVFFGIDYGAIFPIISKRYLQINIPCACAVCRWITCSGPL